jgi:leucyl aminopeptidase (aminopeptidase T)
MRYQTRAFTLLLFVLAAAGPSHAQSTTRTAPAGRYSELARRIVATSAAVKPGEAVVIAGGKHTIPLMEALAIEIQKAGGFPNILLASDSVTRSYFRDVPAEYLEQEPRYFGAWVRAVQVWISLPNEEDFAALVSGVPEARVARAAESGQFIAKVANESGLRFVGVGFPSRGEAAANGVPFAAYEQMQWAAIGADYALIGRAGDRVREALRGAKSVHVTSPAGTDITFSLGDRHVSVDDGQVTDEEAKGASLIERGATLPGGRVIVPPIETSATGTVVVPRNRCRDAVVTDNRFQVRDGKVAGLTARTGAKCLNDGLTAYSGPADRFGFFSIGLNPALHAIPGSAYFPGNAAGMIYLGFGGNAFLGGENDTPGGIAVPVERATVTADGKAIVTNGRLVE